jgi:hypothetical protein
MINTNHWQSHENSPKNTELAKHKFGYYHVPIVFYFLEISNKITYKIEKYRFENLRKKKVLAKQGIRI